MNLGQLILSCNNGIDIYNVNGTQYNSPRELRPLFGASVDWFEIEHRNNISTMYIWLLVKNRCSLETETQDAEQEEVNA